MRFPFFRNRDSVKNGILISIRRTGDGFHPGLFIQPLFQVQIIFTVSYKKVILSILSVMVFAEGENGGMKDLQWILDTAASAYEKRFMKKTRIFVDISFDYTQKIS